MSKYISVEEFRNAVIGKGIDVDGAYGVQCVDLFNYFNKIVNDGVYINCSPSGYAKSIYENRYNNDALNYYEDIGNGSMQPGDWAIWGNCDIAPYSHIAMFIRDNGNGTGVFLGQNQNDDRNACEINLPYRGKIGALRPKIYVIQQNIPTRPETVETSLNIGDRVRIVGKGNGSSYGDSNTAYGIGWERQVLNVYEDRPFPYQIGNETGTTGFYKKEALKKI